MITQIDELLQQYNTSDVKASCNVTKAARAYLLENDAAIKPAAPGYIQGYQIKETTQVAVMQDGKLKAIWMFDVISDGFITGYQLRSWQDAINAQVSHEIWCTVYHLLMHAALLDQTTVIQTEKDEPF